MVLGLVRSRSGQAGSEAGQAVDAPAISCSGTVVGCKVICRALDRTSVHCRGDFGRLGHGDCQDVFLPRLISAFTGIRIARLAAGDTHSLAVTASGQLYSFGRNANGQLGIGTNLDSPSPVLVTALEVGNLVQTHQTPHTPWRRLGRWMAHRC